MDLLAFLVTLAIGFRTVMYAMQVWHNGNRGGTWGVVILGLAVPGLAAYMLWFR